MNTPYDKLTKLRECSENMDEGWYLEDLGNDVEIRLIDSKIPLAEGELTLEYIVALHNAFPLLKARDEAAQKLVEAIEKDVGHNDDCMFCGFKDKHVIAALAEYRKAVTHSEDVKK